MTVADDLRSAAAFAITVALSPFLAGRSEAIEVDHAPVRRPVVDEEATAPSPESWCLEVVGFARAEEAPSFGRRLGYDHKRRQPAALDLQCREYGCDLWRDRVEVVLAQQAPRALLISSGGPLDRAVSSHTPRVRYSCASLIHVGFFTIASATVLSRSSGRLRSCLSLNANVSSLSLPSRKLRRDRSHVSETRCRSASRSRRDGRLTSRKTTYASS